ncbi:MAG TPA: glycoside hydrolase family 15 protein [Verrucomicrobiae bacterium]
MSYQPIENYGIIGNLNSVALVGKNGSIDFLCFPRFDSPSIFAALLDHKKGGHFKIAPVAKKFRSRQMYLPDTNILLTRFLSDEGVATLSDFMPVSESARSNTLIRRLKVVHGEIKFQMTCAPRFDYGRATHTVKKRHGEVTFRQQGNQHIILRLHPSVSVAIKGGDAVGEFTLCAGDSVSFILEEATRGKTSAPEEAGLSDDDYVSQAFKDTMNYWVDWIARSKYHGRWREIVNRSALTLKLLCSREFGSIVAAPTFSLPETIGGERNWDYRFTWIRDASFTIDAFMRLGYTEEATAFNNWIVERSWDFNPTFPLQVVYGMDGRRELPESVLKHFEGYRRSRPVRIGNAARDQFQLDIYGELLDSVLIYNEHKGEVSYEFWEHLVKLVDWVCVNWQRPDDSIWEVRGGSKPFLYSRVLCWVAIDRGLQLAQRLSYPAPIVEWRKARDEIYRNIHDKFWDAELKSFVQFEGSKAVDASTLLMPLIKFIAPTDPRWRSTLAAIEKTLVEDSLVYRYRTADSADDGLTGEEGTFSMCSFWYVECLTKSGDLKQARFIFEKALGYANHLGLYAEQLGHSGEHLGNFPQALSHIGLIRAALNLDQKLNEANEK